jgi:hypothetical protein
MGLGVDTKGGQWAEVSVEDVAEKLSQQQSSARRWPALFSVTS